jgi:hypothetical protein
MHNMNKHEINNSILKHQGVATASSIIAMHPIRINFTN